jgi:hypothetical protein
VAASGPAGRTSAAGLRQLAAELRELHAAVTGGQLRLADSLDGALRRGAPPATAANVRTAAAK